MKLQIRDEIYVKQSFTSYFLENNPANIPIVTNVGTVKQRI